LRVLKAYVRTSDPRVRLAIAKLVESIADRQPNRKASIARLVAVKRGEPKSSAARA
jgi:hypothetical protein